LARDDWSRGEATLILLLTPGDDHQRIISQRTLERKLPGRVPGTRELGIPKTPFVVPYRVHHDVLQILRVYHHARRWPEHF
jgi:hypothetical protein